MAKSPTIEALQKRIVFLEEQLLNSKKEIDKIKLEGLSKEDKTKIAFFENLPDNIAIWASRGKHDNYEIAYWNRGAECIYGIKEEEALNKNFLELFISEDQLSDAQKDCDIIIETGQVYMNNIANDYHRKREKRILITNTFRIEDYSRDGRYLQAEIGIDVSDLKVFKKHRNLEQLATKFELYINLVNAICEIDKDAVQSRSNHVLLLAKTILHYSQEIFGRHNFTAILFDADENLNINRTVMIGSGDHEDHEAAQSHLNLYEAEVFNRIKPKVPVNRLNLQSRRHAICPFFSGQSQTDLCGFFVIEFQDESSINQDINIILDTFLAQIFFAMKFATMRESFYSSRE